MKKLIAIALSVVLLLACIPVVSAASYTEIIDVKFYVQRFGLHMDEYGNVSQHSTAYFTPLLHESLLTDIMRKTDYSVVYKEGSVSSADVTAEVTDVPDRKSTRLNSSH